MDEKDNIKNKATKISKESSEKNNKEINDANNESIENKEQLENMQKMLAMALASRAKGDGASGKGSSEEQAGGDKKAEKKPFKFKDFLISSVNKAVGLLQKSVFFVDRFINFIIRAEDSNRNDIIQYSRAPILFGTYLILVFVVGGGFWACFAPLDSAAVASGIVMPAMNKQIVQSSTKSGLSTIKEILVKQGDRVDAGQPLIIFDDTKEKMDYEINLNEYRSLIATESRLMAERDFSETIDFPEFLTSSSSDPRVEKLIKSQENLFKSRKDQYSATIEMLSKRKEQFKKTIENYKQKIETSKIILQEHFEKNKAIQKLSDQGYAEKSKAMSARSDKARIESDISTFELDILKTNESISENEAAVIEQKNKYMSDVLEKLRDTQVTLSKIRESYYNAKDALDKTVVRSPIKGIINDLNVYTIGAVVQSGGAVAEVTPENESLIVEARIDPKEIASITTGLKAKIKFSAFKSRTSPSFSGTVVFLSPDTVDKGAGGGQMRGGKQGGMMGGGGPVYIAKIELDMKEFEYYAKKYDLKLIPGMQAEVQIIRGTRTLLRYLLDPIIDQMFRSFTEK
jgi:HlyD family secretion protein